jgi:PAS domain S-box-containing protein
MNRTSVDNSAPPGAGMQLDARNFYTRAEPGLRGMLMKFEHSQVNDAEQDMNALRINQIEVELLSDEFRRLKRKISKKCLSHHEQSSPKFSYYILDRDGRVFDAKERESTITSINDYLEPDARVKFNEFMLEVFESNSIKKCVVSFGQTNKKRSRYARLPLHASIEAIVDDERRYCLAVIEDITAQKYAEEREKDSAAALAMLDKTIAASRNEIFILDASSLRFKFANPRALNNLGYTLEELNQLTPNDIQTPVSASETNESIAFAVTHRNNVKKLKAVHKRKDGSLYPVEIYLQYFEQNGAEHIIAIVLDTSNQYAVESQLKSIVESAGAIIWIADINSELQFISDQIQDILGYDTQQFAGSSLNDFFETSFPYEHDLAKLKNGVERVINEGRKIANLRCQARDADGSWRWLGVNMSPNRSFDGQVKQVVGVMHDIHAQKLAEDELRKLNLDLDKRVREEIQKNSEKDFLLQRQSGLAAMGEMIGNIAHQWRQPINSLGLIISDLEDAAVYGECDLEYIQNASGKSKKIIQKMSSTIDDFRHFFRADKEIETFGLMQVTKECINLLDASLSNNNIAITVNCENDVLVTGYANEYSQALLNILTNAKDAIVGSANGGGEIIIEISEEGDYGVHSVIDNGGGIPPDVIDRIFDPHFTTKEKGVGLGLYMTLVSVEKNMKGRVAVENVKNGAKFSLYLPKAPSGEAKC